MSPAQQIRRAAQADTNAAPVEIGTDLVRMQRLLRAADYYLSEYRFCPNYPDMQGRKAMLWKGYQETLAELMGATNG